MHGRVEIYDKQGKHMGEFDPVSGHQPSLLRLVEKRLNLNKEA